MAYTIAEPCIDVKDTPVWMFARSIAYIRQKAKRRPSVKYISSISTLKSALIAAPASPFVPLSLSSRTTLCRKNGSITPRLTLTISKRADRAFSSSLRRAYGGYGAS